MAAIRRDEYDELKRCFGALWPLVLPIPSGLKPEDYPMAVLERTEKNSRSNAARGLAIAINDLIEMSMGWPIDRVAEVDLQFSSFGLITLSELRRRYSRSYKKIVKRGRIKSLEEYYLIKDMVEGNYSDDDDDELQKLARLLDDFEEKIPGEPK